MSVSLLPGIIRAAMVSVKSVMAVWTPLTVVPRELEMSVMATFRLEPAKLQTNWANTSGRSTPVGAAAVTEPAAKVLLVMGYPPPSAYLQKTLLAC
jgi:hypothetical protein